MSARTVHIALALIVGLTIGGSCAMATTVADRTAPAVLIPTATLERVAEPVCSLLADGADSPDADAQWAALVAEHGTLDYVAGYTYGTVYAVDGGYAIGYSLAEDSTIWSDPSCMSSVTTTTHR